VGKHEEGENLADINVDKEIVNTLNKMKGLGLDSYGSGQEYWWAAVNTVRNS
jgi:hypothetical protein